MCVCSWQNRSLRVGGSPHERESRWREISPHQNQRPRARSIGSCCRVAPIPRQRPSRPLRSPRSRSLPSVALRVRREGVHPHAASAWVRRRPLRFSRWCWHGWYCLSRLEATPRFGHLSPDLHAPPPRVRARGPPRQERRRTAPSRRRRMGVVADAQTLPGAMPVSYLGPRVRCRAARPKRRSGSRPIRPLPRLSRLRRSGSRPNRRSAAVRSRPRRTADFGTARAPRGSLASRARPCEGR